MSAVRDLGGAVERAVGGEFSYLNPLFRAAGRFDGEGSQPPLLEPQRRSSLWAEDQQLQGWTGSILVRGAIYAGAAHVLALYRHLVDSRVVDTYTPWTLLRSAVEDFATAVWLLSGQTRDERLRRALRVWVEDQRNRGQFDKDIRYVRTGPSEKTGDEQREQLFVRADELGIGRDSVKPRPAAGDLVFDSAQVAGLDAQRARALWRLASAFAHGRYWPHLRAVDVQGARPTAEGFSLTFQIDVSKHQEFSGACHRLMEEALSKYSARRLAP